MKIDFLIFWCKFHWILFQTVQWTISRHWFRYWFGTGHATSHYLNQWCPSLLCDCVTQPQWVISFRVIYYGDVIMGGMASQITSLTIVYSTIYSDADQRKHQSSASLAFVWGIHRGPVNSPHKWPVMRKMFPFDDVIMSTTDMVWFQGIPVLEFLFRNILTILNKIFHDKSFMVGKKLNSPSSWSSDHIFWSCDIFVCNISLVSICVHRDLMM